MAMEADREQLIHYLNELEFDPGESD